MAMPELHPACAVFPLLSEAELQTLADDIRTNGLLEPITLTADGLLLDGRCRWVGCERAGVEPRTVVYHGNDPIRFAISKNERRRHLSMVERAFIGEALSNLANGSNQYRRHAREGSVNTEPTFTQADAASAMDVPVSAIDEARVIRRQAEPHIAEMVWQRKIGLQTASRAVRGTGRLEQGFWETSADVKRATRLRREAGLGMRRGAKPRTQVKHPHMNADGVIDPPLRFLPTLTDEERGIAPDATLQEKWEHAEKYGRVQIHPKLVKDMMNHDAAVGDLIMGIIALAAPRHLAVDRFFAAIDEMLAWVPEKDRPNGWDIDFAAKAYAHLKQLARKLPVAFERVRALQDRLEARHGGTVHELASEIAGASSPLLN